MKDEPNYERWHPYERWLHAVLGLLALAQNCHLGLSGFEFGGRVEETWEAENSTYNLGLWRGRGHF